jgi:predicted ester cyclase
MKLRSMAMVVFGVGALVAGAGCKKKPKENKAPDIGSASGTGGTMAGTGAGTAAEPAKEAKLEGKGLADRYIECAGLLNDKKLDDFKSKCVAKDYKGHEADGMDVEGPDALVEWFKGQHTAFPDMKMTPQIVIVNGRNILAVGLITGTHTGPLKGPMGEVPPTNKKIGQLMYHRLVANDENRATQEFAYFDPSTMAAQLGLLPKEAPPHRPAMDKGLDGAPIIVIAADDEKEKKNLDAVKKANDAFGTKKMPDIMATWTDDGLESDQAEGKDYKGKKEIQANTEVFFKAFPDFKMTAAPTLFAAGDYVVVEGKFEGTNTGPLGPMKATKKKVTGEFAEVMELKDGKLAKVWRFRNGMAMAKQLGLMPDAPPAGGGSGSAAAPAGGGSGSAAPAKDAPKKDAPKGDATKKDAPKGDMMKKEEEKK